MFVYQHITWNMKKYYIPETRFLLPWIGLVCSGGHWKRFLKKCL